MTKLRCF